MNTPDPWSHRLVTLDAVGHYFVKTNPLFCNITAMIAEGTIVGVCGPSGCGKSTLLALIAGSESPRFGTIIRVGISRTSWVFQNPHGVPRRTAIDHVAFPLLAEGMVRAQAESVARDLMRQFGLKFATNRRFCELSGGEAQRVLLARALAIKPDLLLVDEPTAQLDRRSARVVNDSLGELSTGGAIVVVATHDPDTQAVCDLIIDLDAPPS